MPDLKAQEKPKDRAGLLTSRMETPKLNVEGEKAPKEKPTYEIKGTPKYDVSYENSVITFRKLDGIDDFIFPLLQSNEKEIQQLAATPLRVIWHTYSEDKDCVVLIYDKGMIALTPKVVNGKGEVRAQILTSPDISKLD